MTTWMALLTALIHIAHPNKVFWIVESFLVLSTMIEAGNYENNNDSKIKKLSTIVFISYFIYTLCISI